MKVTVTFEIPEKDVKEAVRHWRHISKVQPTFSMNWRDWIKESLQNHLNAKHISVITQATRGQK